MIGNTIPCLGYTLLCFHLPHYSTQRSFVSLTSFSHRLALSVTSLYISFAYHATSFLSMLEQNIVSNDVVASLVDVNATRTVAIIKPHALDHRFEIEHRITEAKFEVRQLQPADRTGINLVATDRKRKANGIRCGYGTRCAPRIIWGRCPFVCRVRISVAQVWLYLIGLIFLQWASLGICARASSCHRSVEHDHG